MFQTLTLKLQVSLPAETTQAGEPALTFKPLVLLTIFDWKLIVLLIDADTLVLDTKLKNILRVTKYVNIDSKDRTNLLLGFSLMFNFFSSFFVIVKAIILYYHLNIYISIYYIKVNISKVC